VYSVYVILRAVYGVYVILRAVYGVHVILRAMYGEVEEFCGFTNFDLTKMFLFTWLMKNCCDGVLLNFCAVLRCRPSIFCGVAVFVVN